MSLAAKGNVNAKGCKRSDETKEKMSLARKGKKSPFYNKNHSDETKAKMSLAKKDSMVPIEVFDLETQIKTIYPSICAAAQALGVPHSSIVNYFKRNTLKPFKGRYELKKLIA